MLKKYKAEYQPLLLTKPQRDYVYICLEHCKAERMKAGTYKGSWDILFHKLDHKRAKTEGIPLSDEGLKQVKNDISLTKQVRSLHKIFMLVNDKQREVLYAATMHFRNIEYYNGRDMDFCNPIFMAIDKNNAIRDGVPGSEERTL